MKNTYITAVYIPTSILKAFDTVKIRYSEMFLDQNNRNFEKTLTQNLKKDHNIRMLVAALLFDSDKSIQFKIKVRSKKI